MRNWKDYNQALIRRGSLTVWIEQTTIQAWCQNMRDGLVGAATTYSDLAIQAFGDLGFTLDLAKLSRNLGVPVVPPRATEHIQGTSGPEPRQVSLPSLKVPAPPSPNK